MRYYPIHLELRDRPAVVVGGGNIAYAKTVQLVEASARVRVVAIEFGPGFDELIASDAISARLGAFESDDLNDAVLVISATDDSAVNQAVADAARERGILCNIVDQPDLCDFITPALVVRGGLQIGISSSGGSPTLAQRVKREIAELIGEEYGELLELAAAMRADAKISVPDFVTRRDLLRAFVESEALDLLRAGRRDEAAQLADDILKGRNADVKQRSIGI